MGAPPPGFSAVFANSDAQVVLNALTEVTDVNVISSPQLMVLDNQSAVLNVGDQVPIATQSAVSVTDPDAPIVNSVEYRDTGVVWRSRRVSMPADWWCWTSFRRSAMPS